VETYSRHPNDSRLKKLWGLIISMKIIKIFQKKKTSSKLVFSSPKALKVKPLKSTSLNSTSDKLQLGFPSFLY